MVSKNTCIHLSDQALDPASIVYFSLMFLYFEMLTGNERICSREPDVSFRPGSRCTRSNEVTPRSGPDKPVIRGTKNERVYQQRASELAHKRDTLIRGASYRHADTPKSCFPAPER